MAEANDQTKKSEERSLDLSGLSSMSLGPDWVSGKRPPTQLPQEKADRHGRETKGPRKDRRGSLPPRRKEGSSFRTERPERREEEPFKPVVAVDFYPEEEPFRVLAQAIRTSCRTFELFEIARLILEKPDRFVCLVRDPDQKEGDAARLFASVPDGLPFRSEEEALGHTFRHYIGEFFTIETVEVDPPSGAFQQIHRCGITKELIGPSNYHRFQALCREHHAAKLAHLPYAKFEQRLETTREEADIQSWLDKMKVQTRYVSKENPDWIFSSLEDARLYLVTQSKEKLVRPAYSARFSGKSLALLNPSDPIRRSVDSLLEFQQKFPLETANHLRGRLRRMNFAVYKRGSKGISYVCAVKRRFRKPEEILADNLQELIDFLEAHPNFPAKDLPRAFLGIKLEKKKVDETAQAAAEDVAEEIGAESPPKAPAEPELSPAEIAAIRQLKNDLHYLVSEGYITEYSDGRLFVPPIREEEIRHAEKKKEGAKPSPSGKIVGSQPDPETDEEAAAAEKQTAEKDSAAESGPVPDPMVKANESEEVAAMQEAAEEDPAPEVSPEETPSAQEASEPDPDVPEPGPDALKEPESPQPDPSPVADDKPLEPETAEEAKPEPTETEGEEDKPDAPVEKKPGPSEG